MKLNSVEKAFILVCLLFGSFIGGTYYTRAWEGTDSTVSDGYIEGFEANYSNLYLESEFYWNDTNRTDTLAYPEQESSYIVWKDGSNYYARNGHSGQIDYSGTDGDIVIQNAFDAGSFVFFKAATYYIDTSLDPNEGQVIIGEGKNNTIIQASSPISCIFDLTDGDRRITIKRLQINGNDVTTIGIDGGAAASRSANCLFADLIISNCTVGFDATNLEDSELAQSAIKNVGTGLLITSSNGAFYINRVLFANEITDYGIRLMAGTVTITKCSLEGSDPTNGYIHLGGVSTYVSLYDTWVCTTTVSQVVGNASDNPIQVRIYGGRYVTKNSGTVSNIVGKFYSLMVYGGQFGITGSTTNKNLDDLTGTGHLFFDRGGMLDKGVDTTGVTYYRIYGRTAGTWETNVALTATTLDTGQGANELYDMDQNVLSSSDVDFNSVNATEFYLNGANYTALIESLILAGANPFDQSLNTTDNVAFNSVNSTEYYLDDVNVTDQLIGTTVELEGVLKGNQPTLNFHEGVNVTLTISEDVANNEIDITIASTGGGSGIGGRGSYDYIIYVDGSYYVAEDATGSVIYNSTSAHTVFNSVADDMSSGGKCFVSSGTYTFTSPWDIESNNFWQGAGIESTFISAGIDLNDNLIEITTEEKITLMDMQIDGNKASQSAGTDTALIYAWMCSKSHFVRLYLVDSYDRGLYFNGTTWNGMNYVDHCWFISCRGEGLVTGGNTWDEKITNCWAQWCGQELGVSQILLYGPQYVQNVHSVYSGKHAFELQCADSQIIACYADRADRSGYYVNEVRIQLTGCKAFDCGQETVNTHYNFWFDNQADYFRCVDFISLGNSQVKYCVLINAGVSYGIIDDGYLSGAVTANYYDAGSSYVEKGLIIGD